jgi:hypothetical protein
VCTHTDHIHPIPIDVFVWLVLLPIQRAEVVVSRRSRYMIFQRLVLAEVVATSGKVAGIPGRRSMNGTCPLSSLQNLNHSPLSLEPVTIIISLKIPRFFRPRKSHSRCSASHSWDRCGDETAKTRKSESNLPHDGAELSPRDKIQSETEWKTNQKQVAEGRNILSQARDQQHQGAVDIRI